MTEDRGQMTEDRSRNWEVGMGKAEKGRRCEDGKVRRWGEGRFEYGGRNAEVGIRNSASGP